MKRQSKCLAERWAGVVVLVALIPAKNRGRGPAGPCAVRPVDFCYATKQATDPRPLRKGRSNISQVNVVRHTYQPRRRRALTNLWERYGFPAM